MAESFAALSRRRFRQDFSAPSGAEGNQEHSKPIKTATSWALLSVVAITVLLVGRSLDAQESAKTIAPVQEEQHPSEVCPNPCRLLRFEEDYRYLRDPTKRTDLFDPVKFIPFDEDGSVYLSLGGEVRERYERYTNYNWGKGPQDDGGYLLQRYMLHVDFHAGDHIRFFGQVKSGLEYGREGGPRPADRDQGDIHQAFVDGILNLGAEDTLTVRLGRQEMNLGSSRMVSTREGPNVRQSFQGADAILNVGGWRLDGFVTRPVETNPGAFDDEGDEHRAFWGLYASGAIRFIPGLSIDLYYLGLERDTATFDQGTARELRHSVGTRLWGKAAGFDWNVELVYQTGTFGQGDIRAWTAASESGYTLEGVRWTPRIAVKADVASGDHNRSNPDLGTFNALFPRPTYSSETDLIGPANLFDVHPSLDLHLWPDLVFGVDWVFLWRQSTSDGVYGAGINPVRPGNQSDDRYIGNQINSLVTWTISRHLVATLYYSHCFAGDFLKETPPGKPVDFMAVWATFRF